MTYRRLYPNLPDAEHLSPRLVALATEARAIAARRSEARVERDRLSTEAAEEAAREADRQTTAVAIRAGRSVSEAGSPAWDELRKARELLDQELGAVDSVLEAIETEMTGEFIALQDSDKASGRTALRAAERAYRKALDALPALRADFIAARGVHDFMLGASGLPGCGSAVWPATDPGLPLNTLSRVGTRDYDLRPVSAVSLLRETFAKDFDERTDK